MHRQVLCSNLLQSPPPPKVVVEEAVLGETLQVCPRKPFLLYCLSNALY